MRSIRTLVLPVPALALTKIFLALKARAFNCSRLKAASRYSTELVNKLSSNQLYLLTLIYLLLSFKIVSILLS